MDIDSMYKRLKINSWQYLDVDKADFQVSQLLITDRLKSRG